MLSVLIIADYWLHHLVLRGLFKLLDRLPPYRRNGRYRSQSMPGAYSSLRKRRIDR